MKLYETPLRCCPESDNNLTNTGGSIYRQGRGLDYPSHQTGLKSCHPER
jgi:hypothetical protein